MRGLLIALSRMAAILVAIAALAALDVCVLEVYLKPLSRAHGVPWSAFEAEALGVRTLAWHFYFAPAGLVLAGFAGYAVARARGVAAGAILFACGFEDALYYAALFEWPPAELPWLDPNPAIAWTRAALGTPHVTRAGLAISLAVGFAAAAALLAAPRRGVVYSSPRSGEGEP